MINALPLTVIQMLHRSEYLFFGMFFRFLRGIKYQVFFLPFFFIRPSNTERTNLNAREVYSGYSQRLIQRIAAADKGALLNGRQLRAVCAVQEQSGREMVADIKLHSLVHASSSCCVHKTSMLNMKLSSVNLRVKVSAKAT